MSNFTSIILMSSDQKQSEARSIYYSLKSIGCQKPITVSEHGFKKKTHTCLYKNIGDFIYPWV